MVGGTTRLLVWASTGPESSSTTNPAQRPQTTARPTFRMASLPLLPAGAGYTPVGSPEAHIRRPGFTSNIQALFGLLSGVKPRGCLQWLLALTVLTGCTGEILPADASPSSPPTPGPPGGDGGPGGSGSDGGVDAGPTDGGRPDAGAPDAGPPDSGVPLGRQRFPASSTLYQDISGAPLASNSQQVIDH